MTAVLHFPLAEQKPSSTEMVSAFASNLISGTCGNLSTTTTRTAAAKKRPINVRTQVFTANDAFRFALDVDRQLWGARLLPVGDVPDVPIGRATALCESNAQTHGQREKVGFELHDGEEYTVQCIDSSTIRGIPHHVTKWCNQPMNELTEIRRANLRAIVARDGLSSAAKRFQKPDRQLNDMIAGRKSFGEKVARAMELSYDPSRRPGWLDEPDGFQSQHVEAANVAYAPTLKRAVPLISSVQAGMWTEIVDNFQPGDAEAWIQSPKDLGPHGFALRVKGDSMTTQAGPYSFPDGMILHVNPGVEALPGKFVIVRRNGHEATFKRLVMIDGEMYLEALNPDWPNRYIKLTSEDYICGVVVYYGMELP